MNYLPWYLSDQDHLPSCRSSGCILQLCKVSLLPIGLFKSRCAYEKYGHKDGQGDSYIYTPHVKISKDKCQDFRVDYQEFKVKWQDFRVDYQEFKVNWQDFGVDYQDFKDKCQYFSQGWLSRVQGQMSRFQGWLSRVQGQMSKFKGQY